MVKTADRKRRDLADRGRAPDPRTIRVQAREMHVEPGAIETPGQLNHLPFGTSGQKLREEQRHRER